jgi:hypothetical protein
MDVGTANQSCRIPAPKSEARNPKSEEKSEIIKEAKYGKSRSLGIRIGFFEFLISFAFRASNFGFPTRQIRRVIGVSAP